MASVFRFSYLQTDHITKCEYKNGQWGQLETRADPYINIHIGCTALHYGQACFEGLKAFHCRDGAVRLFRPLENAHRMSRSAERICMPSPPPELFLEAVRSAVRNNLAYMSPYGTGGAMYIRPVLFGSGPRIGLQPSDEYTFAVLVLPVADYYQGGLRPVTAVVVEDYDRAAPRGVGHVKVAGNYAADLLPNSEMKKRGFPIALYLDAKTNSYVEEFSTSNFVAVDKTGVYVTTDSAAILPSITNKSLMQLAQDSGVVVQRRKVALNELLGGAFSEVGACGTAVVVTPVNQIVCQGRAIAVGDSGDAVGPVLRRLYDRMRAIQIGEEPDKFGWLDEL